MAKVFLVDVKKNRVTHSDGGIAGTDSTDGMDQECKYRQIQDKNYCKRRLKWVKKMREEIEKLKLRKAFIWVKTRCGRPL